MKKIIIGLVIAIGAIASLPMIGNSVAEEVLKSKVDIISKNGVEIQNEKSESSYLNTKKHYEFLLSDALKFMAYINQDDTAQMPFDSNEMLKGLLVGMDIEYSNIPIYSKLKIDMYPLKMPTEMDELIKRVDKDFYSYLDKLIQSKTFLYHMNYDLSDNSFDGYIKNVDEKYEFTDGTKLQLNILDAKHNGQGPLQALKNIHTNVEKFAFDMHDEYFNATFKMDKLNSDSVSESENSTANITVKSVFFTVKESSYLNAGINLDSIKLEALSKIMGDKVVLSSKSSVGEFKVNYNGFNIIASGFNYDIKLDEIDKASFEKFSKLLDAQSRIGNFYPLKKETGESIIELFSKGFKVNITDLSLAKLSIDNKEPVDGFNAVANLVVKEEANLANKLETEEFEALKIYNFTSTVKLSKDFYSLVNNAIPERKMMMINSLSKEDANNMLFEIKLDDGNFTVNGKRVD